MGSRIRYAVGLCLQVVGLLNFVFLVGVPIWWFGRRLCRDARADGTDPSHATRADRTDRTDRAKTTTVATIDAPDHRKLDPEHRSVEISETESRARRRAPLRRN